ncbi:MAG: hypothetical protein WBF87_10790 [Mesorhizobium sp.]
MYKIILASVAVFGLAGAATAQESPAVLYGPLSQNISNFDQSGVDRTSTASTSRYSRAETGQQSHSGGTSGGFLINQNENYSGR